MNKKEALSKKTKLFKKRVGKNIKFLRMNYNKSSQEFADDFGISRTLLYRIENGQSTFISLKFLHNLGENLVDLDRVFREDIEETIKKRNTRSKGKEWQKL
jgi:transcriptional regulator with XRE-family HTH domain